MREFDPLQVHGHGYAEEAPNLQKARLKGPHLGITPAPPAPTDHPSQRPNS